MIKRAVSADPGAIAPLSFHYTWSEVFDPDGDSGCTVHVNYLGKYGEPGKSITLAADPTALQVKDSGPIAAGTTIVITLDYAPGSDPDKAEELPENGIYVLPSDIATPVPDKPGLTYLAFRKTPGATPEVEYLGRFGGPESIYPFPDSQKFSAKCTVPLSVGPNPLYSDPQSLYFVPVPIERETDETDDEPGFQLIEHKTAKALPGQRMKLRLQDTYLTTSGGGGVTLDTFQWTIPDKTFKNYKPDANNSHYEILPAADLQTQELTYYWRDAGDKEPKVDFHVKIGGTDAATENSKAKMKVDKPGSKFERVIGGERVAVALDNHGNDVQMFGLYSTVAGNTYPGIKWVGSVTTPSGWANGEWNYVQLIKYKRNYTYSGPIQTHVGDGSTFKLDDKYPYGPTYAADGITPPYDPLSGDTPRDPLTGKPLPSQTITQRTQIEVHDVFETYLMYKPPGGANSRYVPLRKLKWNRGGVVSSPAWTAVTGAESPGSDPSGAECTDHPQWSANGAADVETAGP